MNLPINSTLNRLYVQQNQSHVRPDSTASAGLPPSLLNLKRQLALPEAASASAASVLKSEECVDRESGHATEAAFVEDRLLRKRRREKRMAKFAAAAVKAVRLREGDLEVPLEDSFSSERKAPSVEPCPLPRRSLSEVPALDASLVRDATAFVFVPLLLRSAAQGNGRLEDTEDKSQKICQLNWGSSLLVCGPSGVGKTFFAEALVGSLDQALKQRTPEEGGAQLSEAETQRQTEKERGLRFFRVCISSFEASSGGHEESLEAVFEAAIAAQPSVLVFENLDLLSGKSTASGEASENLTGSDKLVALIFALCRHLDAIANTRVLVIGECESPASLPSVLRRSGRFDKEVFLKPPEQKGRRQILEALLKSLPFVEFSKVDCEFLAARCAGFVAADLHSLVQTAVVTACLRNQRTLKKEKEKTEKEKKEKENVDSLAESLLLHANQSFALEDRDFLDALTQFKPTFEKTEGGFHPRGNRSTRWAHVGGLGGAKRVMEERILFPVLHPTLFKKIGLRRASGVLLFGPPGCGKTLLARALADECRATFLSVKGPELLSKFVGESEGRLRSLFRKAASFQPCVIFFDELDALCGSRGGALNQSPSSAKLQKEGQGQTQSQSWRNTSATTMDSGNSGASSRVEERLIAQMLTELDGLSDRGQVFVVGATNRPDALDVALLRPGRFEVRVYVQLPTQEERTMIFRRGLERIVYQQVEETLKCTSENNSIVKERLAAFNEDELAKLTPGFSGADIDAVLRSATLALLRERREAAFKTLRRTLRDELREREAREAAVAASSSTAEKEDAAPPTEVLWRSGDVEALTPLELLSACRDCRGVAAQLAESLSADGQRTEDSQFQLEQRHVLEALKQVRPSVTDAQIRFFEEYAATLGSSHSAT